jgi:zinc D-Ala-D-Ala carboxypeptidase
MTRAPAGATYLSAAAHHAAAFDDRFPTQPIPVGRHRVGLLVDDRGRAPGRRMPPAHREPPPSWHHHGAPAGAASHRAPARTARPARPMVLVAVVVVIAAVVGVVGYQSWAASSSPVASGSRGGSVPATSPAAAAQQAEDAPPRPPGSGRTVGKADGVVPDGVTVFDDEYPAVAKLDAGLLKALRQAAKDAADDGVTFYVNSGWRSRDYQNQLLREAVSEYGSEKEAARWVATADTSRHVSGDAVDIGRPDAAAWLSEHGAGYGLCQTYRNEPWHYELRPDAVDRGCPRMYADPTQDPRMQK